jgi:ABC-type transport system substrate-binding protein
MTGCQWAVLVLAIAAVFLGCGLHKATPDSDENVLHLSLITKIQTLDSGNMRDVYGMTVGGNIFEALFGYHYLKRPYEVVPVLAEDLPQISEDKLTYTIRIRQDVRFQDDPCFADGKGRQVTAHDIVYAIKRIANVKYRSQNWPSWNDRIVGLDAFRDYTRQFADEWSVDYDYEVEGLRALDDFTLQIKLVRPWPQVVESVLSDMSTAPVAKEAVDYYRARIPQHPVGTGPYRLKTWRRGSYVELVRNANWRGQLYPSQGAPGDAEAGLLDDAGKPLPFVDRIFFRVIEEDQPRWLLFMRGELDFSGIPKDNFDEAIGSSGGELTEEMIQRNIRLETYIDPSTFWVGFNLRDPVLGPNKPLRMAISRAIDRQALVDLLFNGRFEVAHGFVSPGMNSYDPNIAEYGYSRYDPAEAAELLKEAEKIHGGPIGPLKLGMPGVDNFSRQYAQFLQKYMSNIGLRLNVEYMDWPTYMSEVNNGHLQLFASGVSAGMPDAIDFLELFGTKYFAPGGNKFFYSNPEYDTLLEQAQVMFDSPERTALYRRMERMVMDDYPAVFTTHRVSYALYHSWYKNYKPHVFSYNVLKYRRVDQHERARYADLLAELKKR